MCSVGLKDTIQHSELSPTLRAYLETVHTFRARKCETVLLD